ncbi:MAG: hypothetical protein HYR49_04400 [Gammaproteobacteria bacterium]|nr:hypothetical protein [Gammaproteobacteria bacterium]
MIAYVTSLIRYESYGWVYKVDLDQKRVLKRARIHTSSHTSSAVAVHGGPHGLAWADDLLVTVTFSDLVFLDRELNEVRRHSHPYLADGHGLCSYGDHIWVSSCSNDAILRFSVGGEMLEYRFLEEEEGLMGFFGHPTRRIDRDYDYRWRMRPYKEHLFHVNHVQETDEALYLSLNKQAVIWDLKSNTPACTTRATQIHDGQLGSGGRYLLNDTGGESLMVSSGEGKLLSKTPVDIRTHLSDGALKRIRASLPPFWPRVLARIPLVRSIGPEPRRCRINWVRGLCEGRDGSVWIGSSPASILRVDPAAQRVTDCMILSENVYEGVFGIMLGESAPTAAPPVPGSLEAGRDPRGPRR